ncbi:PucR family transcriptional regulator [Thalassobacillus hwangdonensis]|uniref:PucR family transcriptional regulator n=1 Tax=Thalassobacillus hwangdonensis TaxID=546108 RepID=A0ABW3L235_9BACI
MTISVHEALTLPAMGTATLIAGTEGVHNQIKWVTIVEVIEDIERLQEGEFLVTTGYGVDENNEQFQQLLASKKLSGIAIYTGFYLKEIPSRFIQLANDHDMPLIDIPTDVNFSTITKGILEQIVNRQMEMITSSLAIHKQLTSLVLEKKGDQRIAETLSELIHASIWIYNSEDQVTRQPASPSEELSNLADAMVQKSRLTFLPQQQETNNLKVIVHPIIASGSYYGCIMAVKPLDQWAEIDVNAIEHAATVFAIEYLQKEAVDQTEVRMREEFLEEIINHSFKSSKIALERGVKLGYDLSLQQAILHVKLKEYGSAEDLEAKAIRLQAHVLDFFQRAKRQVIVRNRLDSIVILFEVEGETDPKQDCLTVAYELWGSWKEKGDASAIQIGVGNAYDHVDHLSQSAMEAQYAVDLSHLLLASKDIVHFDDLGTFHFLLQMKEIGVDLSQFYQSHIGKLLENSRQGIDLLYTLEAYFKHNLNLQETSQRLFIHRHTLKYRLRKMEEESGLDLSSADERLKIQLAIAAYKIDQY